MPLPDRKRLNEYATKGVNLGLRTLAIAPEQREARALATTGTTAEGGPRVLILSPRGWSYHLQVEGVLGQALAERGAEVHVLTCGGGLPICDRTNTWQAPPMPCTSCTRYTTASVTAHGHRHHQLRLAWEDDPGDGLPELDEIGLADLERFEKGDLPLGALTAIPVRWFLMNSHLDDDPLAPATVRSFLRAADRVGRGVAETLENVRPDVVLLLNGLFFFEAITWELCRRQGIDVVTYERGFLPHTLEFRRDLPACRHDMGALWEDVADRPLDERQDARLDDYLEGRRDRPHPVYDFWQGAHDEAPDRREGAKLIAAFSNVTWDSAVLGAQRAFASTQAWLDAVVALARRRPQDDVVLRVHPAETRQWGKQTREPVEGYLAQAHPDLPPNLTVIGSKDPRRSYPLMEACDLGLVLTSTTGLELALLGKPVIVAGQVHYRDRGFTLDPSSAEEFDKMVNHALEHPQSVGADVALARRYAHALFFTWPMSFPQVTEPYAGLARIRPRHRAELADGADRDLDRICDGILGGGDFVPTVSTAP